MSNSIEFQELALTLRKLLKQKKITYRMLAKGIGISESSVKKLFISKDCSLSRLSAICRVLGIDLYDLLHAQRDMPALKFRFTPKQEQFLIQNEKSFFVYWKLVYERWEGARIRQELSLTDSAYFKELRALDRHDLIELLPGGELRFPDMSMTLWENTGPLVAKVKREWPKKFLCLFDDNAGKPGYHLALRMYKLRPETQLEFVKAMEEILLEFGRRSVREERLHPNEVIPLGLVLAMAPRSFVN